MCLQRSLFGSTFEQYKKSANKMSKITLFGRQVMSFRNSVAGRKKLKWSLPGQAPRRLGLGPCCSPGLWPSSHLRHIHALLVVDSASLGLGHHVPLSMADVVQLVLTHRVHLVIPDRLNDCVALVVFSRTLTSGVDRHQIKKKLTRYIVFSKEDDF